MELLKQLNESFSVCGYEEEIREVVARFLSKYYDVHVDRLGNVIAHKAGTGEHLVFLSPMDVPGAFLNVEKEDGSYFYTKLATDFKVSDGCNGRSADGVCGSFHKDEKHPEGSFFKTSDGVIKVPSVAEVTVPFSIEGKSVTTRNGALFAMLKLSEQLCADDRSLTFVALAQTALRHRGAYGEIPVGADAYTLIELCENDRFKVGDGAILCLKDGAYIMPLVLKQRFASCFENRLVCEEKPSLAATLMKQKGGFMVASMKIPVVRRGTDRETVSLADIDDLIARTLDVVKKG